MRGCLILSLLVACAGSAYEAAGSAPLEPGQSIPAFEREGIAFGPDGAASTVAISSRKTERPTAYLFLGTRCETTAMYLTRMAALEKQYAGRVDFVYLYPNKTDSREEKQAFHRKHQLRGPMVDDQGAAVAHGLLGGRRTAELVLADKAGVVLYTGAIDNDAEEAKVTRRHFALAIDQHLAGKPVSQPKSVGNA